MRNELKMRKEFMGLKSYPRVYFELVFVGFTLVMGMSLSAAFLPIFASDLDPSGVFVGFVISVWFFSRIFIELPSGVLSDRLGRRKLLVVGLALAAGGALICAVANSIYLLIIGRAILGLGTALFFMNNTALILDIFKPSIRGRALGTFQGIEFIGSFIGAPLGGFIADIIGYNKVFYLAFILMICSLSVAFLSKDLRRISTKAGAGSKLPIKQVFSSFQNWSLNVVCINSFSRMFIMQGVMSTVFQLYLNKQLGVSIELIGIILSLRTMGHIVATVISGHLSDIFGRRRIIVAGLLIEGACLYMYTLFSSFEPFLLVGLLEGFGGGMVFISLIVLLYEIVPVKIRGGAIGLYRTFMDTGGFLGPLFFMLMFSLSGAHASFFSAIAILTLDIGLLATVNKRGRQSRSPLHYS